MLVKNYVKFMSKDRVFEALKSYVNSPKKNSGKLTLKITGYMSKVISTKDRENSIWVKESMALISGLGKFKQLLEIAPAVIAIVDSMFVYFLSHKNMLETNLKPRRLGTLLHLEYPNLMIMAVKGTANISDKLSRLFSLPKTLAETISLSHLKISPDLPEIQNKAFSIMEAREYVTQIGIRHSVQKPDNNNKLIASEKNSSDTHKKLATLSLVQSPLCYADKSPPDHTEDMPLSDNNLESWICAVSIKEIEGEVDAGLMNLTRSERLVLENINLIRTLGGRISKPNIMIAQASMPKFDKLLNNTPIKVDGREYKLKEGLIENSQNGNILIPPKLEGTVLSQAHVVCGHMGWHKLFSYVRSRYDFVDKMKEKCRNLATLCHVCYVSNPSTHRKSQLHSIVASYPNEIVTADLLEVESVVGKRSHKILVICDYFTKAINAFDMTSFTSSSFISRFKDFLQFTGHVTKLLIVDNATFLSESSWRLVLNMTLRAFCFWPLFFSTGLPTQLPVFLRMKCSLERISQP